MIALGEELKKDIFLFNLQNLVLRHATVYHMNLSCLLKCILFMQEKRVNAVESKFGNYTVKFIE